MWSHKTHQESYCKNVLDKWYISCLKHSVICLIWFQVLTDQPQMSVYSTDCFFFFFSQYKTTTHSGKLIFRSPLQSRPLTPSEKTTVAAAKHYSQMTFTAWQNIYHIVPHLHMCVCTCVHIISICAHTVCGRAHGICWCLVKCDISTVGACEANTPLKVIC